MTTPTSRSRSSLPPAVESAPAARADVVVLGGGVIGLACALELLGAGRGVRVLERGSVGSGASHGNGGLVTPSHATPLTQPGMVRKVLGWMLCPGAPIHVRLHAA